MLDLIFTWPTWAVGLAFVATGLVVALGCLIAVRHIPWFASRDRHADLIGLTVSSVAALFGVLLAFLTIAVWQDYSDASANATHEASLIGNLLHDVEGLPPPLAADLREHVRSYLQDIADTEWPLQARGETLPPTRVSLIELHRHVSGLSPATAGDAVVMADLLHVLNELDAARATRLEALGGHIPPLVWTLIVVMSLVTVGLAAAFPAENVALHAVMLAGIVVSAASTMLMIVELDDPFRGAVSVSAAPYRDVLKQMGSVSSRGPTRQP